MKGQRGGLEIKDQSVPNLFSAFKANSSCFVVIL